MALKQLNQQTPDKAVVLTKAIIRAAEIWKLKNRELAAILGLSETSISRLRDGSFQIRPESKSGELAVLLLRLFRGLDAFTGGHQDNQRRWLEAENVALGAAPLTSIQNVAGLAYAVQYMDCMRGR